MPTKGLLLRSLVKLLELVLPEREPDALPSEAALDPPLRLAVRVVQTWARVNEVPLPRLWIVYTAERCPHSNHIRSEIHWAVKTLFTRIRDDHAYLLEDKYRFKLELAVATAARAWRLIEEKDADEEMDSECIVDAYAAMFQPS